MLIKAGTVLTFQIHYTTNGKAATDKTQHRLQVREAAADDGSARGGDGRTRGS